MASLQTPEDSESSISDPRLDEESEGYEDVEPDVEEIEVIGLFDGQTYRDAKTMLDATKEKFAFDFIGTQKSLGLDFYGSIKLVNYIRSEVQKGNKKPDVSSSAVFSADSYLQPVLENDSLLFSLDDLPTTDDATAGQTDAGQGSKDDLLTRVQELEDKLNRLGLEYRDYRSIVAKTLDDRWASEAPAVAGPSQPKDTQKSKNEEEDKGYFASYGYNDIHETMLKDTVRTNAYRDFILSNRTLFANKVVLDIGCGTGILSLFCAQAGASRVLAVDNSRIIDRTRVIVHANGYSNTITCIRGKIEEVVLPVPKVDIIVSEWMGYALLYEAMLDSVLWARDRYLKPDGLMVPSHCTLRIAPVTRDVVAEDKKAFWKDVYGFNLSAMMEAEAGAQRNVVQTVYHERKELAAPSVEFLQLPLHTITTAELSFTRSYSVQLDQGVEHLGGWLVYFDTFFLPSRDAVLPSDVRAVEWARDDTTSVAFSTGPEGPKTHWECAFMSTRKGERKAMAKGAKVEGTIEYKKQNPGSRGLDIRIAWEVEGAGEKGEEIWTMGIDE